MRIAITGGAGFIGSNLCRELLSRDGIDVSAIDNLSTGGAANLHGLRVTMTQGSILDPARLDVALAGAQSIVHLAARPSVARSIESPSETHAANASGTLAVLEAARRLGIPHVVIASSSSVYGGNPATPKSEDLVPMPLSPYAASKLATEAYALSYQASLGLRAIVFRFFNVYGPFQPAGHAYAACIPAFITAALNDEPLTVFGDGKQSRDFTYVADVARVLADAAIGGTAVEEPVNLAFGGSTSLLDLIEILEDIVGKQLSVRHEAGRPGDVRHSRADAERLRELFPDVEPVSLRDGLAATVEWWKERAS